MCTSFGGHFFHNNSSLFSLCSVRFLELCSNFSFSPTCVSHFNDEWIACRRSSLASRVEGEASARGAGHVARIEVLRGDGHHPAAGPGLGGTGRTLVQEVPAVRERGQGLPAGDDVLLVHGELAVEVVDHAGAHPDDDEDEQQQDDDHVGRRHVQGDSLPLCGATLLVPAELAVPHAVTLEVLVNAVGVVTVVAPLRALLNVVNLEHLCEHSHELRGDTFLIPIEPERSQL